MICPYDGAEMELVEVGKGYKTWLCPHRETQLYENVPVQEDAAPE